MVAGKKRIFPPLFRPIKPAEKFFAADRISHVVDRSHGNAGPRLDLKQALPWSPFFILSDPKKPKWLKARRRRRVWGLDWWEDDYHYATEWFSKFDSYTVERETAEYYESLMDDFSKSVPKLKLQASNKVLQSRSVVPYNQPHFLRVFYWRFIFPIQKRYLKEFDPSLYRSVITQHEFKYAYGRTTAYFIRKDWNIPLPKNPKEHDARNYYYGYPFMAYKRLDLEEFRRDYVFIKTKLGRLVVKHIPWWFNFFARVLLDLQNVAIVSFWLDIKYRGFSVQMLRLRWKYFYYRIANLAFLESYLFPVVAWYVIQHKRKAAYAPYLFWGSSTLFFVVAFITMARKLSYEEKMRDLAFDSDLDTLRLAEDSPKDPLLEELYDPSDTSHSHVFSGSLAGVVGQDDLAFLSRSHYTAPLYASSWWMTSNEKLLHFVYAAERDFVIQPQGRIERWCRRKLRKWFPSVELWLIKKKMPGYRTLNMTRFRFAWWMRWQWFPWTMWGRHLKTQHYRFWTWTPYYEYIKGIQYHGLLFWQLMQDEINLEIRHRIEDEELKAKAAEEEWEDRILNGPPRQGYID